MKDIGKYIKKVVHRIDGKVVTEEELAQHILKNHSKPKSGNITNTKII